MGKVLIIENDTSLREYFSQLIEEMGHEVLVPSRFPIERTLLDSEKVNVVILEAQLEGIHGAPFIGDVEGGELSARSLLKILFRIFLTLPSPPQFIVVTKVGFPAEAKFAIENGVVDYIQIPPEQKKDGKINYRPQMIRKRLSTQINHALHRIKKRKELTKNIDRSGILGNSFRMISCLELAASAAKNDGNVIITGETGTGKELFAKFIHLNSARADKPFIALNCAAIPKDIAESELFGIEGEVVTGVPKRLKGKIEQANEGTLFLDEVGDLPLSIQAKLLRALQERSFNRVGGTKVIMSDFRLVSATNRDLEEMTKKKTFRADLLYRLKSIPIELPPLRERREDIKELVKYYLGQLCESNYLDKEKFELSPEFMAALNEYNWPGNVRELMSALTSATSIARGENTLLVNHLPLSLRIKWTTRALSEHFDVSESFDTLVKVMTSEGVHLSHEDMLRSQQLAKGEKTDFNGSDHELTNNESKLLPWEDHLAKTQERYLKRLMMMSGYNMKKAHEISKLSESHLYKILKKSNISTKPQPQSSIL